MRDLIRWQKVLGCAAGLLVLAGVAGAAEQDPGALLLKISGNAELDQSELRAALRGLTPTDVADIAELIVAPGTGDDTNARMILHALVWQVRTEPGKCDRAELTQKFGDVLAGDKPVAVKRFFVQQLQLVGGQEAVAALARSINDDELGLAAVQALVAIGGDEAGTALLAALPQSTGRQRIAVINALGALQVSEATLRLTKDCSAADAELRHAAIAALADLGVLVPRTEDSEEGPYTRGRAYAHRLAAAAALARQGQSSDAAETYAALYADAHPTHVRCAALAGLVEIEGTGALQPLQQALAGDNPELAAAAEQIAVRLTAPDATASLIALAAGAEPTTHARLISIMARRGDPAAIGSVRSALTHDNADVQLAAVRGLPQLAGADALEALVDAIAQVDPRVRRALHEQLVALAGPNVSRDLATASRTAPPAVRAELIYVLADRRAGDTLDTLRAALDADEAVVRIAAIEAVGRLGDRSDVPRLLKRLPGADTGREHEALEDALVATAGQQPDRDQATAPLVAALATATGDGRATLLQALGRLGGDAAFAALHAAITGDDADLAKTAYRALGEWPQPRDAGKVLRLAAAAEGMSQHVLAFRAFARLFGMPDGAAVEERIKLFDAAMEVARRPDERRMLLAKLGEFDHPAAVRALRGYIDDDTLGEEATAALVNVAEHLVPDNCEAAERALELVRQRDPSESLQQRMTALQEQIDELVGFITRWHVAGPYMREGVPWQELIDVEFAPEQSDADVSWKPQPVDGNPANQWRIDLNRSIGGGERSAYLRTYVHSDTARDVQFQLGSDDTIKAWLNGDVIHRHVSVRGCDKNQDQVDATLKAGWNELMLKITNGGGGWAAAARLCTPEGKRLRGVRIATTPSE